MVSQQAGHRELLLFKNLLQMWSFNSLKSKLTQFNHNHNTLTPFRSLPDLNFGEVSMSKMVKNTLKILCWLSTKVLSRVRVETKLEISISMEVWWTRLVQDSLINLTLLSNTEESMLFSTKVYITAIAQNASTIMLKRWRANGASWVVGMMDPWWLNSFLNSPCNSPNQVVTNIGKAIPNKKVQDLLLKWTCQSIKAILRVMART